MRTLASLLFVWVPLAAVAQDFGDPEMPGAIVRREKPKRAPCVLELSLAQQRGATQTTLEATLKNVSGQVQTFRLASRCPAPSLLLAGLPEAVEPFGTCAMGACMSYDPIEKTLAPGERFVVGTATLHRDSARCGAPLTGGPFTVTAAVPFVGAAPEVCGPEPIRVRGYPAPVKGPAAPTPAPPPSPVPSAPKCQPIACARPMCPPGQVAKDDDGCPSCSCR